MVAKKPAAKSTTPAKLEGDAKDWTYLTDKEPSALHEELAAFITEESGIKADVKVVQAVLAMHGTFQKSQRNKARDDYRARTAEAIYKTGVKTAERFEPEPEQPAKPVRAARKPRAPKAKVSA